MKNVRASLISTLLYLQGLSLIGLFTLRNVPHVVHRVGVEIHNLVFTSSEVAAILLGTALMMVARSIRLRRYNAWLTAIWLQALLILTALFRSAQHILHHHHSERFIINRLGITHLISEIAILVLLIIFRSEFRTVADPHTRKRALSLGLRATLLSLSISVVIVLADRHSFVTTPNFTQSLRIAIKGFLGISESVSYVTQHAQDRLEFMLGGLGVLSLTSILFQLLQPLERKVQLSQEDEAHVRTLLANYPENDSLGYFALRDDKSIIYSKNKKAAISYSVVKGVMVTTGDPIGDSESWPDAMRSFIAEASRHAWIPCIYGCSERTGEIWVRETGFSALEIGDEAVIDVSEFTLEGPAMKNVRQMVARIKRTGVITHIKRVHELTAFERAGFIRYADEWRRGGDERGFSMALGRVCQERDNDLLLVWAEKDGVPEAFLQFVPWGDDGLSLDTMRRAPSAETGINEELISSTALWAQAHGIEKISLNFATFRSIFERGAKLGAGPITRFNYRILKFLSRYAQMESLYRFNAKFRPIWEPRFVIYPSASTLLKVTVAILRIESFWPPLQVLKR